MEKVISVSKRVAEYIKSNKLSVRQISQDTGVSEDKLLNKSEPLNATEFLEICSYLNVRPEDMR